MPVKLNAFLVNRTMMIPGVGAVTRGQRIPASGYILESAAYARLVGHGLVTPAYPIDSDVSTEGVTVTSTTSTAPEGVAVGAIVTPNMEPLPAPIRVEPVMPHAIPAPVPIMVEVTASSAPTPHEAHVEVTGPELVFETDQEDVHVLAETPEEDISIAEPTIFTPGRKRR